MSSISTKLNVSHKAKATVSAKQLTFENAQLNNITSNQIGKSRNILFRDCKIDELSLKELEIHSIEIIDCEINTLSLDSLKGIGKILVRTSKVDHLSILRNFGFQSIALEGLIIKDGKILQNNGCSKSTISIDLESKKLNKLDVMYNYADQFDLMVPGKVRSLHLRRNNFENIEFKNSNSPHTSVKVKSA